MPETESHRYAAFISYRHVEPDRKWAKWLHRALETYKTPKPLAQKGVPARIGRVFRDEDELPASADLSQEIARALEQSRFLIVACSPRTPQSEWVNQEVVRFRGMGRHDQILALLIEGEPAESFPRALREIRTEITDDHGEATEEIEEVEPLAADVRKNQHDPAKYRNRMALLRILASLLGCRFDDLRHREQERRRRRLLAGGAALLVLALALAGLAIFALHEQERAESALSEVLKLSDSKVARDLVARAEDLELLDPTAPEEADAWLDEAHRLLAARKQHEDALSRLRRSARKDDDGTWIFVSRDAGWQHSVLVDLLADLDRIHTESRGLLSEVQDFAVRSRTLRESSIRFHQARWTKVVETLPRSPHYGGLEIPPQVGLAPLGVDPHSGLFEFAHVGSGSLPTRRPDGTLTQAHDTGFVFVLVPGGSCLRGAQRVDPDMPGYSKHATDNEAPVHTVRLSPFFISKCECTESQWAHIQGDRAPDMQEGSSHGRIPQANVSWREAVHYLSSHGLGLPTEAQWEYACRAGTTGEWSCAQEELDEFAWFGVRGAKRPRAVQDRRASAFGLHDMHGNLWEWVRDLAAPYETSVKPDPVNEKTGPGYRVIRGGCVWEGAECLRSSYRGATAPGIGSPGTGFRSARRVIR